jgi:benzoyl-CoA reductase/2-hydroxyglutaryl-CoA dehydratase subunit BcrC/BadD/HgdB
VSIDVSKMGNKFIAYYNSSNSFQFIQFRGDAGIPHLTEANSDGCLHNTTSSCNTIGG